MFDRIAGVYDRMNSVMTAGLHHQLAPAGGRPGGARPGRPGARRGHRHRRPGLRARRAAWRPTGRWWASTSRSGCSSRARQGGRARRPPASRLRFETANALALPYADDEFDAATVGFGARNFSDLDRGLREMARVVRPGGRVVVLEITTPTRPPLSTFFELWFDRVVPALGRLAGDAEAYSYLPSSVRRFPGPEALAALMWASGLRAIRYVLTAGGIIALHVGEVPSA